MNMKTKQQCINIIISTDNIKQGTFLVLPGGSRYLSLVTKRQSSSYIQEIAQNGLYMDSLSCLISHC